MPTTQKAHQDTMNNDLKYVTIMGIKINSTPKDELLIQIHKKIEKKEKFYIVTPNPEIILQAQSDPKLTHSLNSSNFSIPDGVGLKLASSDLEIIKGRELMIDLFKLASDKKLKIYLLGSTQDVITVSISKLKKEYKNIKVEGNSGPELDKNANPVSEGDINLQSDIVKEVNLFKPDLLFVAFGAPKQEIWISKFKDKLNVTGIMAVGGSFDYYSGFIKQVPAIFSTLYIEWLWRLVQEPKRFRRIINAILVFPFKLLLSKF